MVRSICHRTSCDVRVGRYVSASLWRRMRIGCRCILIFLIVASGGCATVRPPANPRDPVPVYLTDYGVHSSLLMPNGDGRFVEYYFGDWGFAVDNRNWPQDACGALLVSGQAALGRRYATTRASSDEPRFGIPELLDAPHRIQQLWVSREKVREALAA